MIGNFCAERFVVIDQLLGGALRAVGFLEDVGVLFLVVELRGRGIERDEDLLAELVAGLLHRGRDATPARPRPTSASARSRLRRRPRWRGRGPSARLSAREKLPCRRAALRKSRRAFRHDHEFLEIDRRIGVRAAVEDVHHRHRQDLGRVARRDNERGKPCSAAAAACAVASETPRKAFAPSFVLFGVPSSSIILSSIFACSSASKPRQRRRDRLVHAAHRFGHAFAAVALLVAVAQFPRFVLAGARAARNGGAADGAACEMDIDFDGRIAARIEDLARVNFAMLVAHIAGNIVSGQTSLARLTSGEVHMACFGRSPSVKNRPRGARGSEWVDSWPAPPEPVPPRRHISHWHSVSGLICRHVFQNRKRGDLLALLALPIWAAPQPSRISRHARAVRNRRLVHRGQSPGGENRHRYHPDPGRTFCRARQTGETGLGRALSRADPDELQDAAQIALNLGGLIADGFIAVEAQDTQQVKNIGGDIVKLAKALGVSENILARGNSINQFAENNEWSALQEELEATQNEVKASMQSHRDQDLVILVSLGGWIRGTQVVSGVIAKNYDERLGQVLRQPELLRFIRSKISQISPELRNDPLVSSVNRQLLGIEQIVAKPFGQSLSAAEVTQLNESVNQVMQEIQTKD